MFKLKNLPLTISLIVVISLIVGWGINLVLAVWGGPTCNPPPGGICNANPPITTTGGQTIGGNLSVSGALTAGGTLSWGTGNPNPAIRARHIDGKAALTDTGDTLYLNYSNAGYGVMIGDGGTDHPLQVSGSVWAAGSLTVSGNTTISGTLTVGGVAISSGIPSGMIAMFAVACPSGWTRFTALDGSFPRGAATYGGAGGSTTIDPPNTTSTGSGQCINCFTAGTNRSGAQAHTHDVDIAAFAWIPPYLDVVFCQKN